MSSRSALGLIYILRGLQDIGEDVGPLLTRYGLDLDAVDPTARIARATELKIYVELAQSLKDPLAGLKAGSYIGFTGYGPLTMLLLTSAHAMEAIRTGIHFQELTYLFGHLRFMPGAELSALVLKPIALPGAAYRFRVDGEVVGTYKLIRDMQASLGLAGLRPDRIDMPYPAPPEAAAYAKHFDCPVHFGEDEARLWIRNDYLRLRFPTADATARQFYWTQCEQLLQNQQAAGQDLAARVSDHLQLFAEDFPNAAAVAAALGLSERSLRRQLSAEGQSFRALLDEVRFQRAKQLLGGAAPVEAIALQLGYAEASSFIHAFQRWTGQSPAAFRRQQRQDTPAA